MKTSEKAMNGAPMARPVSTAERERMIAEAAYFRALGRNFQGGDALDDWCCAEREIDLVLLSREERPPTPESKGVQASRQPIAANKALARSAK